MTTTQDKQPTWLKLFQDTWVRDDGLLDIGKYSEDELVAWIKRYFIFKERCRLCGKRISVKELHVIGTENGFLWLHRECWVEFITAYKKK